MREGDYAPAILIAVSDEALQDALSARLRDEGYALLTATDGETALRLAQQHSFLLAILDRALPPRDGLDLCRQLREQEEMTWLPILMITTQEDEMDAVVGLEVGADDYILWPCRWSVLRARIRALVRRSRYLQSQPAYVGEARPIEVPNREQEHVLSRGDVRIDLAGRVVMHHEERIDLSPRLFDLLVYLASHADTVISRKQLIEQVYRDKMADERQLDVYIHLLREKLEDDPAHPQRIQTVRGVGYRFHVG